MTNCIPNTSQRTVNPVCTTRLLNTTRTSWMANNTIPDSIIMNMTCGSLEPSVEPNEPNVWSTKVGLNSLVTLRILNTIKPVIRAFTAMDVAKPVRVNVLPQGAEERKPRSIFTAPCDAIQVARGDTLKLSMAYRMKINLLTYVCDCQEWRNYHDTDIVTPHDPTTEYLLKI